MLAGAGSGSRSIKSKSYTASARLGSFAFRRLLAVIPVIAGGKLVFALKLAGIIKA